jgi:hypothetical protein
VFGSMDERMRRNSVGLIILLVLLCGSTGAGSTFTYDWMRRKYVGVLVV